MTEPLPVFRRPSPIEKLFNRAFGFLIGPGLGFYNSLLQVRGRESAKFCSTPVNLLDLNRKPYLVAPRGRTQWIRNAEATGVVTLKRGSDRQSSRLRPLLVPEHLQVLKSYLDRFKREVQRDSPVPAVLPPEVASPASSYRAFEPVNQR